MPNYDALRYLLDNPSRLFPEERLELQSLIGRAERLEKVNIAAEAFLKALPDLTQNETFEAVHAFAKALSK